MTAPTLIRSPWLLLCLLLAAPAWAQAPKPVPEAPSHRLILHNASLLRVNPLGLENQTRLGYQSVLYRDDRRMLRDNYLYLGALAKINPIAVKAGPLVELQPLSVFTLRLFAEYMNYFSTVNALQSFSSPNQEHSDAVLAARGAAKQNYAASGLHALVEPLLVLKFGPLLLRNRFSLEYWRMRLRGDDRVWYDPMPDTLLPSRGFTLSNEVDLLVLGKSLLLGGRYFIQRPLYTDRDYAPGEARTADNGQQRLGLLAAYVFFEEPYTSFNRPTLLLNMAWYLQHRYRTGAEVSRAVPYVLLAFSFQSDLLGATERH